MTMPRLRLSVLNALIVSPTNAGGLTVCGHRMLAVLPYRSRPLKATKQLTSKWSPQIVAEIRINQPTAARIQEQMRQM